MLSDMFISLLRVGLAMENDNFCLLRVARDFKVAYGKFIQTAPFKAHTPVGVPVFQYSFFKHFISQKCLKCFLIAVPRP